MSTDTEIETTEKQRALAVFLECDPDEITESTYDDCLFEHGQSEYLVCTEEEANQKWEEQLDSYLEDCVYPELPESMRNYFDDDAWKRDARMDGRGHAIASYDGDESDAKDPQTGESFVIFRMN